MRPMPFAWLLLALLPFAPQQPPAACSTPAHRAFDFWVGEWTVTNTAGKTAGTSRVERILDGCVVMENWSGVPGPYQGKSFNTYNPVDGTWTQHWVDTTGASVVMNGKFEGRNLVYGREFVRRAGKPARARMTFFNLEDGRVRQFVEQSIDEGRTWTPQIDLTYTRTR